MCFRLCGDVSVVCACVMLLLCVSVCCVCLMCLGVICWFVLHCVCSFVTELFLCGLGLLFFVFCF